MRQIVLQVTSLMLLILVQSLLSQPTQGYIQFNQSDSSKSSIEVPDSPVLSVSSTGSLTVAAWMKPDTLDFKYSEGNGYVHWLGKGQGGMDEWVFRMYNSNNSQNRVNRISFYVLNLTGGEGIGSYFEYPTNAPDPVRAGEWIFVVGVVDGKTNTTSIYEDGVFIRCDKYYGDSIASIQGKACQGYPRYDPLTKEAWIVPKHGSSPLLIGRSGYVNPPSYFQGGIAGVRIWNRALNSPEIEKLYSSVVPQQGLVAQYLLDENSGNIAHDSVGGHDGKIMGTSWRWSNGPETVTGVVTSTVGTKSVTETATVTSSTTVPQTSSTTVNPIGLEIVGISGVVVVIAIVAVLRRLKK